MEGNDVACFDVRKIFSNLDDHNKMVSASGYLHPDLGKREMERILTNGGTHQGTR